MRLVCSIVGIMLAGCGGRTTGPGDDGSGDGSGDDGGSDDGGDGSGDGDGGDGDDGSGDGGTGDVCDPFRAPDDIGPAVAVTIENSTDADVYVWEARDCAIVEPFAIAGPDDAGPTRWFLDWCEFTCDAALDGGCACPGACPQDTLVRITPGGRYELTWGGSLFLRDMLPDVCVGDELCGTDCWREIQAGAGRYTLAAAGNDTASCAPSPCDCEPGPEGSCLVTGQLGDTPLEANATIEYPSATSATLTF